MHGDGQTAHEQVPGAASPAAGIRKAVHLHRASSLCSAATASARDVGFHRVYFTYLHGTSGSHRWPAL